MTTRRDPSRGEPTTPWRALVSAWDGHGLNTIFLDAQDNALEGGEIQFAGGGNGGSPLDTWNLDSWSGMMRLFTGGITKWTLDTSGNMGAAGTITANNTKMGDVGFGSLWAGLAHSAAAAFSTTGYALLQKNDGLDTRLNAAVGGQVGLFLFNTLQWALEASGHFVPGFDNARDIGRTAMRLRDVYVAGEVVGENGANYLPANQAAIGNALTDVNGTAFTVGPNEAWVFDIFIPYARNANAGTVNFAINGPAGAAVAMTVFGTTTALSAFLTTYNTSLGTAVGALGSLISSGAHFVRISGKITTAGTAGVVAARAITSAAGTTMTPQVGTYCMARRIS
jgi:hypothetical protein